MGFVSTANYKNTVAVSVGNVIIGGGALAVVQSMTNTDTEDYLKTAIQSAERHKAGFEITRITVNSQEAAIVAPKKFHQSKRSDHCMSNELIEFNGRNLNF